MLEIVGAASVTIGPALSENPTEAFTGELSTPIAKATLLAIAIGAIAANSINIYSGAMAFVTIGIKLPAHVARALVTVFFGVAGFLVAWWALPDAAQSYENFLLLIAYWIGPWLGIVFADQYLRRGQTIAGFLYDRSYANWGGLASFAIGLVVSVLLFSNQEVFTGFVAKAVPQLGDITFFVGFLISGACYLAAVPVQDRGRAHPRRSRHDTPEEMLDVAVDEARKGLSEGGIPIGAALFSADGVLLGSGHNRRVQDDDPSVHGETDAFRAAGRQRDYRSTIMVTTLSPCWYCSGLVRQFNIGAVVIGEARTFSGGHDWLAENGVAITILDDERCVDDDDRVHRGTHPDLWLEDIGE